MFSVTEDPLDRVAWSSMSDSGSDSGLESVRLRVLLVSPFRKSLLKWEESECECEGACSGIRGGRDILLERILGEDNGDVEGEIGDIADVRVSRIMRIERTIFSWMTARQSIRSSRKAVGVYKRWNSAKSSTK
jgi:hypothetical protein